MEAMTLQAEVREARGKGPARRLRMEGKLPAVLYGPGNDPTPLTVSPKELVKILKSERGRNTLIELSAGDKTQLAMVKDLDQDPVSHEPIHVDFYRVDVGREIDVVVPFELLGRPIGVQEGGILNVTMRALPLHTTPDKIPSKLTHDVSELDMHQAVHVEDLELPEGVRVNLPPKRTLAIIIEDRRAAIAAKKEAEEAEAAGAEEKAPE